MELVSVLLCGLRVFCGFKTIVYFINFLLNSARIQLWHKVAALVHYSCLSLIPHINQKIQEMVVMMAMVKGNQIAITAQRE